MNAKQRRRVDRVTGKDRGFREWLRVRPKLLNKVSESSARIRYTKQLIGEN